MQCKPPPHLAGFGSAADCMEQRRLRIKPAYWEAFRLGQALPASTRRESSESGPEDGCTRWPFQHEVGIGSCVESAIFLLRMWIVKAALLAAACASAVAGRNSSLSARYQKTSSRPHTRRWAALEAEPWSSPAAAGNRVGRRSRAGASQGERTDGPTANLAVHHLPGPSVLRQRFSPRHKRLHCLLRRKASASQSYIVPTSASTTAADQGVHSGPANRRSNTFRVTSSFLVKGDKELR